jgi:benzoylformate decarboxylase
MARRARDVLIDILRDEGITHVFGNPGSTEMPLMDALVDAPDITYVLGLQEATAVGMADGWALASGRAAFVNLHAMGGLGNAMGVLVASKASETPLVVTAGQQDTRHLMTEPWLSGDLVALAAPVAKWAKELRRADDVGPALRRAFGLARTPPCGPVFLSLPMDILDQDVNHPTPPASAPPRLGPSPDAARLADKLAVLDPDRVVVLLGDDLPAAASTGLVAFAEAGGFPVWGTQLTSRTAFPSHHPCWAGVLKPDFADMRAHLKSAQAIVLVGGRAFVAYPYREAEPVPEGVAVMHIADNPEAFGREHAADIALLGDISQTLAAVAHRLVELLDKSKVAARLATRGARRREAREATRMDILAESATKPLSADAAVLAALDALPEDAIIANDSAATFGRVQDLMTTEPGRDRWLGRLVRRRRWRDVFAAGFVERRALQSADDFRCLQQSPLWRVAERRQVALLRQRESRPVRGHGRRRSGDRLSGAGGVDGRASGAGRRSPRGRRGYQSSAQARRPVADRDPDPLRSLGARLMQIARVDEFRHIPAVADR